VGAYRSLLPSRLLRHTRWHPFNGSLWCTWQWSRVPANCGPTKQLVHTWPGSWCLRFGDFLHILAWPWTVTHCPLHRTWSCIPSNFAKPFSLPEAQRNLQRVDANHLHLILLSLQDPICRQVEGWLLLCKTLEGWSNPRDPRRLQLQRRWESYPPIPPLRERNVRFLPICNCGCGDYLQPAALMLLQVTSQG